MSDYGPGDPRPAEEVNMSAPRPFYLSLDDLSIVVPVGEFLSPKSQNVLQTFIKLMTTMSGQDVAQKQDQVVQILGESLKRQG